MTERPIIFSAAMVRAILAGKKTQTRRVIKPQPGAVVFHDERWWEAQNAFIHQDKPLRCPYGQPGDVLWVKETWQTLKRAGYASMTDYGPEWDDALEVCDPKDPGVELAYRATDGDSTDLADMPWRPSIFMPRWASRLSLPLKSVRVERVQDISDADAWAEGVQDFVDSGPTSGDGTVRGEFAALWDSINGTTYPFSSNPWVWVLEFPQYRAQA